MSDFTVMDVIDCARNIGATEENVQKLAYFLMLNDEWFVPEDFEDFILFMNSFRDQIFLPRAQEVSLCSDAIGLANLTQDERRVLLRTLTVTDWHRIFAIMVAWNGDCVQMTISMDEYGYPLFDYALDEDGGFDSWCSNLYHIQYYSPVECALPNSKSLGGNATLTAAELPVLTAEGYTHTGWISSLTGDAVAVGGTMTEPYLMVATWEEAKPEEPTGPDTPTSGASIGEKYLLRRMFHPLFARALGGE